VNGGGLRCMDSQSRPGIGTIVCEGGGSRCTCTLKGSQNVCDCVRTDNR
jgi:hypothetical protein